MQKYYFTFGIGSELGDKFHVIQAETSRQARQEMVSTFGTAWAFQYSENDWERSIHFFRRLEQLDLERWLAANETRTYRTLWNTGNPIRKHVFHAYTLDDATLSFKRYLNTKKGQHALKQACERYNCIPLTIIGSYLIVQSTVKLEHVTDVWFEKVVERPQ